MSTACEASVSLLKHNLLAGLEPRSDVLGTTDPFIIKETKMKIALIGAAAVAAAAFATPVLAQAVIENPGRWSAYSPLDGPELPTSAFSLSAVFQTD